MEVNPSTQSIHLQPAGQQLPIHACESSCAVLTSSCAGVLHLSHYSDTCVKPRGWLRCDGIGYAGHAGHSATPQHRCPYWVYNQARILSSRFVAAMLEMVLHGAVQRVPERVFRPWVPHTRGFAYVL